MQQCHYANIIDYNRATLLSNTKLCASFRCHMLIQTVRVRKWLNGVMASVTLTFGRWPFAWTSLLSLVITPENFMMIRWWEHSQKGVTDRQTDTQTDRQRQTDRQTDGKNIHRAAWSQLKTRKTPFVNIGQSYLVSGNSETNETGSNYFNGSLEFKRNRLRCNHT